jgi:hypothetical protein
MALHGKQHAQVSGSWHSLAGGNHILPPVQPQILDAKIFQVREKEEGEEEGKWREKRRRGKKK